MSGIPSELELEVWNRVKGLLSRLCVDFGDSTDFVTITAHTLNSSLSKLGLDFQRNRMIEMLKVQKSISAMSSVESKSNLISSPVLPITPEAVVASVSSNTSVVSVSSSVSSLSPNNSNNSSNVNIIPKSDPNNLEVIEALRRIDATPVNDQLQLKNKEEFFERYAELLFDPSNRTITNIYKDIMKKATPEKMKNSLRYDTKIFQPLLEREYDVLFHNCNYLRHALTVYPAKDNKQLLLEVVSRKEESTFFSETPRKSYVTGGAPRNDTQRMVLIYNREGNVTPKKRNNKSAKRNNEECSGSSELSGAESDSGGVVDLINNNNDSNVAKRVRNNEKSATASNNEESVIMERGVTVQSDEVSSEEEVCGAANMLADIRRMAPQSQSQSQSQATVSSSNTYNCNKSNSISHSGSNHFGISNLDGAMTKSKSESIGDLLAATMRMPVLPSHYKFLCSVR